MNEYKEKQSLFAHIAHIGKKYCNVSCVILGAKELGFFMPIDKINRICLYIYRM